MKALPPPSITEIAGELRNAREAKGLTQAELGRKIGMPQSHISTIEQGRTDLRLSNLLELARQLDHDVMLIPRKYAPAVRSIRAGHLAEDRSSDDPDQIPAYGIGSQTDDALIKDPGNDNDTSRFRP